MMTLVSASGERGLHEPELFDGLLELHVELRYDAHAAPNRVLSAHVGFEHDRSHGVFFALRRDLFENVHDVSDAEQAVSVLKLFGFLGREIRSQSAFFGTSSSLVFAGSTGLACASFYCHW